MKKYFITVIAFIMSASMAGALDLSKNLGDTAEMKALNTSLKAVQNNHGPIVFVTGKADVDVSKCKKTLNVVASIIKKYPRFVVTVEGHTDNVGDKKGNMTLSQKRAEAVMAWLVKSGGVPSKNLKAKGFGDSKPIADNKTPAGRNKNRRVDFDISKL